MDLNNVQTIFTILYGLYFAVVITLTRPFNPFDTPEMFYGNLTAWFRFVVSFISINIIPLFFFWLILNWLGKIGDLDLSFYSILGLFFLSIIGFGFYRIYWGIMLLKRQGKYIFYDTELPESVDKELKRRENSHKASWPHLIPGILWIIFFGLVGYLLLKINM